jgi:septal ring factor EnvC (AmiA/AmiB activator)
MDWSDHMPADSLNENANLAQVLTEYGQSMIRVGQLEKELELTKIAVQSSGQNSTTDNSQLQQEIAELHTKLQGREQELVALRLQVETLRSEISDTKSKLKLAAEGNYIRHRKNKETPSSWKKLLTRAR